ncbi:hypothetical protein [Pseudoxanthomonas suwonensis]|nr:hypothetical protein [Pseudoxanthomonas suwonensis]
MSAAPHAIQTRGDLMPVGEAAAYFVLSVLLIFAFAGSLAIGFFPISAAVLACAAIFFFFSRKFCLILVITATLFQNLIVATTAYAISDLEVFRASQAINFVIFAALGTLAGWILFWAKVPLLKRDRGTLLLCIGFICLLVAYAGYGTFRSTPGSVAAYFRQFSTVIFALVCGIHVGRDLDRRFVRAAISLFAFLVIVFGAIEIASPDQFYSMFGVEDFYKLKLPTEIAMHQADLIAESFTQTWLNFSGQYALDIESRKLLGPTLHNISFAYAAAIFALASLYYGRVILALLLIALLVFIGAKGPLIITVFSVSTYLLARTRSLKPRLIEAGVIGVALAYSTFVILYGISSLDIHVIGLLAGLNGLIDNPLGHGLGVGGNLSDMAREARNIVEYRNEGVPFAIESAMGVLMYQVGVFFVLLIIIFFRVIGSLRRAIPANPINTVFLTSAYFLLCNSFFQEEALSPAAGGLFFLLYGIVISQLPPEGAMTAISQSDRKLRAAIS